MEAPFATNKCSFLKWIEPNLNPTISDKEEYIMEIPGPFQIIIIDSPEL